MLRLLLPADANETESGSDRSVANEASCKSLMTNPLDALRGDGNPEAVAPAPEVEFKLVAKARESAVTSRSNARVAVTPAEAEAVTEAATAGAARSCGTVLSILPLSCGGCEIERVPLTDCCCGRGGVPSAQSETHSGDHRVMRRGALAAAAAL